MIAQEHTLFYLKPTFTFWLAKETPFFILFLLVFYISRNVPYLNIIGAIMCLLILFFSFYKFLMWRSYSYEISGEKIKFSRGVFNRYSDFLELYRVKDISVKKPFFMRLFGLMYVSLETSDLSHPNFTLVGLPISDLPEDIRTLVEINRQRKNVYEVD